MRTAAATLLLCMTAASASAQGYNPHAGDSVAPSPGTIVAPLTPNGMQWLNDMLGLDPAFFDSNGRVSSQYVPSSGGSYTLPAATSSALGGVKVGTGLDVTSDGTVSVNVDLSGYLPLAGGTMTGDLNLTAGLVLKDGSGNYIRAAFGYNKVMFTGGDSSTLFDWPGSLSIGGSVTLTAATGTGNAFACIDASGNLYRSSTACQ